MSLYSQISDEIKVAMKSGDKPRVEVLRFVLSGLNGPLKEKQIKDPAATLSDDETLSIIQKEAKKRRESIELFKQGKREDLASKEEAELAIIATYLPTQLSREEIEKIIADLHAAGNTEFKTLIRAASEATRGKADGKLVAEIVKAKIG
jgi:hypothetical protein